MQRIVGLSLLGLLGIAACLLYANSNRSSRREGLLTHSAAEHTSVHLGTLLVNAHDPATETKPATGTALSTDTKSSWGAAASSSGAAVAGQTAAFAVTVRKPAGPPRVELAGQDPQGRSGSVACSTCHSVRPPNFANTTAATLDEFHQGLQFQHGNLACYACHNPHDADTLRLADQTSVAYTDVMDLCAQCHGLQATAMAHGAHGGMNGFWDLSRGPQTKNNCIDCHDPHQPIFPKMIVGFKPRDRFLEPQESTPNHD